MTSPNNKGRSEYSNAGGNEPDPIEQDGHPQFPNETNEEYRYRHQSLKLEAEARRLKLEERKTKAARVSLVENRLISAVSFLTLALEVLLLLRLLLRISGANINNTFAGFIYRF